MDRKVADTVANFVSTSPLLPCPRNLSQSFIHAFLHSSHIHWVLTQYQVLHPENTEMRGYDPISFPRKLIICWEDRQ